MASNISFRISTPGKVILHGEHSVVYDKLAFAASLGLRTRLEFCEVGLENDVASLEFVPLNLLHFYTLQDLTELLNKPLPLTKASANYNLCHPELLNHDEVLETVKTFVKERSGSKPLDPKQSQALVAFFYLFWSILGSLDLELCPFKIKIESDLTIGAGTGSSASYAVTLAACLLLYARLKKSKSKNSYKSNSKINVGNTGNFDKFELELISKWAYQSEKIIHGRPSGVDNTICTYGGLVEFRKGTTPKLVEMTTKFSLILINTNVPRDTKLLVEKVAIKRENHRAIIDGILEVMDEVAQKALGCMKRLNGRMGDEFDVLEHYDTLGELADVNQNLLRCLGVSHPKLDEACQILASQGLHAKLTGAGGGGYAICLVPPHVDGNLVQKVINELNLKGFNALLTDLGGCGVRID